MLASKHFHPPTLLLVAAIALSACAGEAAPPAPQPAAAAAATAAPRPATATARPTEAPKPTAAAATTSAPTDTSAPTSPPNRDPITGAPGLARGALTQRPYVVMIDNHPEAYPQTGLDHATVVIEALAEFGVTRFMAVYAPGISPDAPAIGPVRSTRVYFAQWAMGFHALYAHAGGSPQGLALVESTDQLVNLDALSKSAGGYFWRSKDRDAPHNLYTSSDDLARAAKDGGVADMDGDDPGFLFKNDAPVSERPSAQQIDYFFIYREDNAGWIYDPQTNGYLRLRRDRAARDAASGEQLWAKDVVVMEVHEAKIAEDPKGRIEQEVIGSGPARTFIDGTEREVTWRKSSASAPLRFYDAAGSEVRFNAGPIWIAAVPSLDNLTIK